VGSGSATISPGQQNAGTVEPGRYFVTSKDGQWIAFNTGLQNIHGADLLAIFERYKQRPGFDARPVPDWVFKGCYGQRTLLSNPARGR
jgi:hypothetical protein